MKPRKLLHKSVATLSIILAWMLSAFPIYPVQARQPGSIQMINLPISAGDIIQVDLGYHYSSFVSQDTQYSLALKDGQLTNGKVKVTPSALTPLLTGLWGMYPGTRPLYWLRWTDDYPHAWIFLHLKNGQRIEIESKSQFDGMAPWNVSLWDSEKAAQPDNVYIQTRSSLWDGIDALWRTVDEKGFPRKRYDASRGDWLGGSPATVDFIVPEYAYSRNEGAASVQVWGTKAGSLEPFVPFLKQNVELNTLFNAGYTLYDAAFTVTLTTKDLVPVLYSGMIALASPGGKFAVAGVATIPVDGSRPVTTSIKANETIDLVDARKSSSFLNQAAQLLGPITFIIDTRNGVWMPNMNCGDFLDGTVMSAVRQTTQPERVYFFPLSQKRWTIRLNLQRGEPGWDDALAETVLKTWFPPAFAALPAKDLQTVNTFWQVAFLPDVTLKDPQLVDRLMAGLPDAVTLHSQNPDKSGDYTFLSARGQVVISEDGTPPVLATCGENVKSTIPSRSVSIPDDHARRNDIANGFNAQGEWFKLGGPVPLGEGSAEWTSAALGQPGMLHVLWSSGRKGVYYAEGRIDGAGWTAAQYLAETTYGEVRVYAWPEGEVHLLWSESGGMIHIWRPAGGVWQPAELWPDVEGLFNVLRDPAGGLDIGGVASDGLDDEFMVWRWTPQKGLSDPENVSRHVGNIGSATTVLRLDSKGQLHAAWSHVLEEKSAPDLITGETPDTAGVFYAHRLSDGRWSKPEQVGTLAPYAHTLSMEVDAQDAPIVLWQSEDGLVSQIKQGDAWQPAIYLEKARPPEKPAEFGPNRSVLATAQLQTGVNTQGQIIAGWLVSKVGLKLASWTGVGWSEAVSILPASEAEGLYSGSGTFQMSIDPQDRAHFVFFKNSSLYYGLYDYGKISTQALGIAFTGYGLVEASLSADANGSIAVLGLPRSPVIAIKPDVKSIVVTATPTPGVTPTLTSQPAPTQENTPTPDLGALEKDNPQGRDTYGVVGGAVVILLAGIIILIRGRKKNGVR